MMLGQCLLFIYVLALATAVGGLDIKDGATQLSVDEEQNSQVWPLKNTAVTGPFTYTLKASGADTDTYKKFSINNTSSELRLNYTFDFEKPDDVKARSFLIKSTKLDNTDARTLHISLRINDVNDHTPKFTDLPQTINVSEATGVGKTLFTITGEDLDGSGTSGNSFNVISFSIVSGNIDNKFETKFVTQQSANLVLNSRLDYDAGPEVYNLTINATDADKGNPNGRWVTSYLVIQVADVDDLSAVFTKSQYKVTIPEDLAPGSFVIKVTAEDKDKTNKGEIVYGLVQATNPDGMFAINETTGNITLVGKLDRKTQSYYALLASANSTYHDPMHAQVLILIEDSNVHAPNFTSSVYNGRVAENAETGTLVLVVQAIDLDKGQNGVIMYSLVGGNGLFSVNQDGHIMVAGSLDYEKNKTFAFYVFANEIQTSEKRQANASVVITITDVNDNSPEFSKNIYEFSVGESPSFPVPVGTVSAPDEDSGGFGEVMYFIVHGDMNGNFTINNKTGAVETGAVLNREVKDRYVLTIQAVDGGSPPRKAVATIIVTVTDQNEQPPYFENTPYRAEIVENKEYSDSPVFKVTAKDPDLMSITYSLVNQSGFSIGPTSGIISATGSFDREKQGVYNLTVNATDQGGLSAVEHVIINVEDTNDNTPQFLGTPYQTNIPDNTSTGVHILTVEASDLDEAHNAEIIFSLLGAEGKFTVNQTTGVISVSGKLDSQEKSLYNLEVIATDRGIPQARSNSTSVVVNLTDYSNHPPEFAKVAFVGEILEGLGTTFVLDVEASDPDSGLLGKITYSITGGNAGNAFSINSTGAILSTKALDFENDTQKAFDLTVTVTDSGGLTDTTQVRITVVDANDNAPQIINLPSPSEFNISDNVPPGTLLYVLRAEDLDSGNNGDLEYNGTALPNNLTIEQATGLITARTKLESTSASSILFTAWVKDKGNPSLSSPNYTIKFNIISDPVSDPFFLRTLTETTVFENASVNDFVVKVNASAPADNFTILFQLPSGGYFKINNEGNISLARPLNRETLDGFSLLVQASKVGKQAIGYVSITIADVNDETPEFPFKVYKGQVNENSPAGSPVLQVKAVDGDKEDTISYGIASGNTGGIFNISSSGGIQIALPPDHENTSFFNLTVVASDGVNVGKTFVEITILDINDNYPVFNSSYSISLPEDTLGGATVLQVSAKDADDDDIVQYSMSGDEGRFTIDSLTGVISTTDKHLDFEETTSYTLNVTASDRGGLKASVLVVVNITDSNDHAPVFSHTSYNVTIEENYVGALSLDINASDADSGSNGNVTYSIVRGSSQFSINLTTGVLNVTSPIDRDGSGVTNDKFCRGVFILTIQASDNGNPKLSDTATVTVRVTDINDNAPTFSRSSYEVVISVLDTGNVLRVVASDADCTTNSDIQYSFTSVNGSSLFEMNATLGNISIVKPLNGSQGVYFLNVTASNEQATPKLQSSVMVTVTVIESKNYPPVFDSNKYTFNVSEGADIGVAIGKVSATDVNQGKDGVFIYSIENPGYVIPFDIEPKTGVIALVREIDRESQMNYTLIVVAQDFGEPPLRQTADVFISVDDVNDIVPKFEQDLQRFNVSENITVGSLVGTVTAVDQDGEFYGQPVYIIYSGNEAGHFRIENSTGAIYLVKKLDREVVNRFELIIHAYNHGSTIARKRRDTGENFDVLKVVIEVTDINDNDPQFETAKYIAGFKLSDPTGTNITQIRATDKDEGSNADIIYSIHEGNEAGAFAIDPKTGVITTANIARLNESKVILTVLARDSPDKPLESAQSAVVTIYKLPEDNPLDLTVSSDLDEDTIRELLQNITGPGYDIIIQGITPDGLLSNVKYYVIKNDVFLTQEQMTNLILAYCEANEEICKRFGINYASQGGNTNALLGEDDMTILEAMLLTLGVIVGIGGLLGILLLCCLRRSRKRYMPVYEPNDLILPSKAVSFDERPHYYQPNSADDPNRVSGSPEKEESQEVEIHMDEEHSSVESAEEARAGSTSSTDIENNEAIAKVQAYMNQALMDDDTDSDTDSSEDPDREPSASVWVGGGSSGSSEQLVSKYTITNL